MNDQHLALRHPFPKIADESTLFYGGNQGKFEKRYVQQGGCGLVGAANLIYYLAAQGICGRRADLPAQMQPECVVPLDAFNRSCEHLRRRFLPVLPRLGMNGFSLVLGLNLYFLRYGLPYRAFWGIRGKKLWKRAAEMLRQDLPVIFSVGPNFPKLWGKEKVTFYQRLPDGSYRPAAATLAHYVTITALDEDYAKISSWGREYYVSRREYEDYVHRHSAYLVSNVAVIRKKKQKAPRA